MNNFVGKGLKEELESILKIHLSGLQRIPSMCFSNPLISLEKSSMKTYEVSLVEPLHDIKGHIKNVWELLPSHLTPDLKNFFQDELEVILGTMLYS